MSELWKAHNYICKEIPFIISSYIREYDIGKANINVLYKYGVLSKDQYEYYLYCPRDEREISIGKLQRSDYKITEVLQNGITEAKRQFFEINSIQDQEVLSIKNDAVFLINKIPEVSKFDNIEFKNNNTYTSYYKLGTCEFYYYYNEMNNIEKLDIKGIKEEKLILHQDYFLEFLLTAFQTSQVGTVNETLELMNAFYDQYINLKLDKEYYREFTPSSQFRIKKMSTICNYMADDISSDNLSYINIGHNLNMMRQLMSYYSTICVDMIRNKRGY